MIVRGTAVSVVHRRLGRHRRRAVSVLDDEVDRHLALETADVSVTEVVAQLVHLPDTGPHTTHDDIHRIYLGGSVVGSLQSLGHWTCD